MVPASLLLHNSHVLSSGGVLSKDADTRERGKDRGSGAEAVGSCERVGEGQTQGEKALSSACGRVSGTSHVPNTWQPHLYPNPSMCCPRVLFAPLLRTRTLQDRNILQTGFPRVRVGYDVTHVPGLVRGTCNGRGFCRMSECSCAVVYAGPKCYERIPLPGPVSPLENASFLLTKPRALALSGRPAWGTGGARRKGPGGGLPQAHDAPRLPFPITHSLLRALPDDDHMGGRLYEHCALVVPGDRLRGLGLQEDIDSHDVVMRFDHAGTKREPWPSAWGG